MAHVLGQRTLKCPGICVGNLPPVGTKAPRLLSGPRRPFTLSKTGLLKSGVPQRVNVSIDGPITSSDGEQPTPRDRGA